MQTAASGTLLPVASAMAVHFRHDPFLELVLVAPRQLLAAPRLRERLAFRSMFTLWSEGKERS